MADKDGGDFNDLSNLENIPDEELIALIEAIHEGAQSPAEAMGFDEDALLSIEQMAQSYYTSGLYDKAMLAFSFLTNMDNQYTRAWRGMGACYQAKKLYEMASSCYQLAQTIDPEDVASKVFWGECLCLSEKKTEGLAVLNQVIEDSTDEPDYLPYVTRARAIIGADGGIPTKIILRREGQNLLQDKAEDLLAAGVELDPEREITPEDMMKNPKLRKIIEELSASVSNGELTFAQIGGFTDNELDGAYAAACQYINTDQIQQGTQLLGMLILIDPYKARYYQLVGIGLQRLKTYPTAEYFYGLAQRLEPENIMTQVYLGECKILNGKTDDGLKILKESLQAIENEGDSSDLKGRAQALIQQFS
jgi:tetratricopeptide (TPR) repeat protein